MPSIAEVINRQQFARPAVWHPGTVTAVAGRLVTVTLDRGGASTKGLSTDATLTVGARIMLVSTPTGNIILGKIA